MRKWTIAAVAVGGLLGLASAAPGSQDGGVKGRVFDVTCGGPCSPGTTDPRPYEGEAKIVARRLPEDRRVAGDAVEDSRFRAPLRAGRYRLKVKIPDPCWTGDSKTVEVPQSGFVRVRFEVNNGCIL